MDNFKHKQVFNNHRQRDAEATEQHEARVVSPEFGPSVPDQTMSFAGEPAIHQGVINIQAVGVHVDTDVAGRGGEDESQPGQDQWQEEAGLLKGDVFHYNQQSQDGN